MGFNHQEWETAKRYPGIVVVPMSVQHKPMDRYEYQGCVSLDFLKDEDFVRVYMNRQQQIEKILLDAAKSIQSSFRGSS